MLAALGVVLLVIGTVVDVLSLSAAALAALPLYIALRELGCRRAMLVYFVTSLLSILLFPQSEAALSYALLLGLYTLLKFPIERLRRPLVLPLKLAFFNATFTAIELISIFLFSIPPLKWWFYVATYVLANVAFLLYDSVLDRLIILYEARLRAKIAHFFE
jgi:hypothetical protein